MLTLEQLFALGNGGAILSRFTMAVKKVVFSVADLPDQTTPNWQTAQRVARERTYQYLATQVIDYASAQAGNPLSETGAEISDAEIEAIVGSYLPKVVRLIA